ncbi:hypothetical protein ILUMI_02422 [Ignelater luminosus]|uniref:Protein transport protein Sec24A n=1 Tax=Ignelater luminosus TaxID=2038154 RepID=A0A8K0DGG1_IGNLU|nr:hypothetical protein ILUMI_02422 [Ignelater luminosus]
MTEQTLPNGLPPQFGSKQNVMPSPVSFNGVDSSHSSRTSSPANRLQQIPASQLPPSRSTIPASQLPPSVSSHGANINQLVQNYAHLSVSQVTPVSSPKVQPFTTSTPVLNPVKSDRIPDHHKSEQSSDLTKNFHQNRGFSPIISTNMESQTIQNTFTHSAHSRFTNVPLNPNNNDQIKSDGNQFQNVPLGNEIKNSNIGMQGESNNSTQSKPTGSLNLLLNNQRSNNQVNTQFDKSSNLTQQDRLRISTQGQMDTQNYSSASGFFQQTNQSMHSNNNTSSSAQPKMQQSASQPLLETHEFKDVPLSGSSNQNNNQQLPHATQQQPPSKSLSNFGSTPNLYHSTGGGQSFNHSSMKIPYSSGNPQTNMPAGTNQNLFMFNNQQNPMATPSGVHNIPTDTKVQNVQIPSSVQQNIQRPLLQNTQPMQQQTGSGIPSKAMPPNKSQQTTPYFPQQQYMSGPQQNPVLPQQPGFPPHNSSNNQSNITNTMATTVQSNIPPPAVNTTQSFKANLHANRYPTMQQYPNSPKTQFQNLPPSSVQQQNYQQNQNVYDYQRSNLQQTPTQRQPLTNYNQNDNLHGNYQQQTYNPAGGVVHAGFSKLWGQENYDLLQCPNVLPPFKIEPPKIALGQEFLDAANCSPDIFRCTMTKIPETNTLLQKSRLPLGILIHPFKDLDHLPVIQCSTIVRCRACRTYINPFVFFVDMKRWKCNLCYRVNELPEEFQFDPVSKTYGDPSRRPEIKSSTIEYIAPSEYMLRPPQPAVYLFLLDVSHAAIESEYLHVFCNVLTSCLSNLPGDARTQVGFIAFNSALHFYSLADGLSQPHEMTVLDIDDIFLPCPDNLIVNLHERKELISDLLAQLPTRFNNSYDRGSALGAALQAAHKMIASTGGRITVFQASLPSIGPGALTVREDPSQRAGAEVHHLNPANDFYKRLALECSGQQIAVDLFIVNSQYCDLATISGISRFSGGCIHHFPLFKASRTPQATSLERTLKRYLTRKIGFEAVMRIRCTRGLSIHTFHGNFFVRSTDLLSLPNVNPEAGFGMQVSIDESLSDLHTVCFQAALLYTSSKGERRIRVHTLCVPIASTLPDVMASADQQCIVGLLAKMAVDRSMQSSLADAREAFINVAIDILSSYKLSLNLGSGPSGLLAPNCMKLLPLYISALLKHIAFRTGTSTRLDDRVKAMCDMKSLPLYFLIQKIYPDLYPVHNLEDQNTTLNVDGEAIPQPPHLQLSARSLDSKGAFLMDMGEHMVLLVGQNVSHTFLNEALGVPDYNSITEEMFDLPNLDTPHNQRLNNFINYLNDEKPFMATLQIVRENSPNRNVFIEHLIEDRIETALSYHEFLQHLKTQVK